LAPSTSSILKTSRATAFEPGHTISTEGRSRVRMLLSFQRPSHLLRKVAPSQQARPKAFRPWSEPMSIASKRPPRGGSASNSRAGRRAPSHTISVRKRKRLQPSKFQAGGRSRAGGLGHGRCAPTAGRGFKRALAPGRSLKTGPGRSPSVSWADRRSRSARSAARYRAPGAPRSTGSSPRGRSRPRAGGRGRWCRY
jgi:hypothetical protein